MGKSSMSWFSSDPKYCVKRVYDDASCAKINEVKTKKSNVLLGLGQECVNNKKVFCRDKGVYIVKFADDKCTKVDGNSTADFLRHGECVSDSTGNYMYRHLTLKRFRSGAIFIKATTTAAFVLALSYV